MLVLKKTFGAFSMLLCIAGLILFSRPLGQSLAAVFGSQTPLKPSTTHIVLFQFKDTTSVFAIKQITSKFFALKKSCLHPSTHAPYIISITGGRDISTENLQVGVFPVSIGKWLKLTRADRMV
jgi:hypothetical protein